jgi:hypothetical protein
VLNGGSTFVLDVATAAALGLWLWAACAGVGYLVMPARDESSDERVPVTWHQPGVAACIGLGALVFLGGISTALRIAWWLPVGLVLAVGTVVVLRRLVVHRGRPPTSFVVIGVVGAAALVGVALIESVPGLRFPVSACDDIRAYLPMAQKLVATNGLVEPWSARRLTLLGGYSYLEALPVWVFGNPGVGLVETALAAIFLGGQFVATGFRTEWTRGVSVALVVAVPFLWVPRGNTTGILIAVPLLVAVMAASTELRRCLRAGSLAEAGRWAAGGGLMAAALVSIRTPLGILAAALLAAAALVLPGVAIARGLRVVGIAAASTVVALLPWSLTSWDVVGSPFYPVFPGNLNADAYVVNRPYHLIDELSRLFRASPFPWIALGVLILVIVVRKLFPDWLFLVIAALGAGLMMFGTAVREPLLDGPPFVRYIAPAGEALVVFLVYEGLRGADVRSGADEKGVWQVLPALVVAATLLVGAFAFSGFTVKGRNLFVPGGWRFVRVAARNATGSDAESKIEAQLRPYYRRALAAVPDPSRAIVSVDRPFLVDYGRDDVPNLDIPGSVAPGGSFPFFTGPEAKLDKLRRNGIDTLVVTSPPSDACLSFTLLMNGSTSRDAYGRFFRDWADDLSTIRQKAPDAVHQFGTLFVIDLERAQRELRS